MPDDDYLSKFKENQTIIGSLNSFQNKKIRDVKE